jgi:glycosyltransferase involved in cell wall biosynthesis
LLRNLNGSYILVTSDYSSSKNLDFSMNEYVSPIENNTLRVRGKLNSSFVKTLGNIVPLINRLPDNHLFLAPSVISLAKKLKKEIEPKVIIAFSRPETDLLIGIKLKKIFGVPLIVHLSDPWVDNPYVRYSRFTKWVNSVLEAKVMKNADLILFTNDDEQKVVMQKYPKYIREKARSIPHCYDETLYHPETKKSDKFIIRHIGNLYGRRGPEPFLRAIQLLIKVHPEIERQLLIKCYGQISEDFKNSVRVCGLEHLLKLSPSVPYLESLRLMYNADLLLLIDAESVHNTFFPSKLVYYMGAKRNILGITTSKGPSSGIIKTYGGNLFYTDK